MSPETLRDAPDAELAALLDAYLSALQTGRQPDRKALLQKHPEVAATLDCLDALERLAPAGELSEATSASEATTLPFREASQASDDIAAAAPAVWFGHFKLLAELGRGGMGVVYKARQKDLDRLVALKMILGNQLASEEQVRRFQVEAQAVARLSHPHIVHIYETGEVHGQQYFAMQYVDGPSLAARLKRGPLPVEEATRCLIPVAHAVAYLHTRGVVHRDLKPANILLDAAGYPYVTDFGLVKLLEADSHMTHSGVIIGTPSYMAPEQAAGHHAVVGPRSDVYSLGAILYEMLTGRPPFREETPLDTLVQVLEGEPAALRQLNPKVPHELELMCLKCLAKDANERYTTAAELADDLERFTRGEAIRARPQSVGQRLARWLRQEPALASHLVVIALCAVISQLSYHLFHPATAATHAKVMANLGAWAILSVACQWLLRRERYPDLVRLTWLTVDAILITAELWLVEAVYSPLLIIYALFIVASGLWFRTWLVWCTTALAVAGYTFLLVDAAGRGSLGQSPHYHVIVYVGLLVLGFMVAYQVQRVRVLSRYYERRPLP
jgi:eukaryotic-like serine/threonine-protein kinase